MPNWKGMSKSHKRASKKRKSQKSKGKVLSKFKVGY